jgi:glutaredoxin 3
MKVILYTAPGCPYCMIVKNYLVQNKIKFDEIDISKDKAREIEMNKKSNQSQIPVVDVNGTIIVGYNLRKLKEALNIK